MWTSRTRQDYTGRGKCGAPGRTWPRCCSDRRPSYSSALAKPPCLWMPMMPHARGVQCLRPDMDDGGHAVASLMLTRDSTRKHAGEVPDQQARAAMQRMARITEQIF